jgi:hypothetical protein
MKAANRRWDYAKRVGDNDCTGRWSSIRCLLILPGSVLPVSLLKIVLIVNVSSSQD